MRVAKKEIRERNRVEDLLRSCPVGRLGTIGSDGFPVIKPLNYVYLGGRIYFHSAREGEKIEDIRRDSRVCFEADLPGGFVKAAGNPCRADYRYQSVIVQGRARIVEERAERLAALRGIMVKYQPEGGYDDFAEEALAMTAVVAIEVLNITGKENPREDGEAP